MTLRTLSLQLRQLLSRAAQTTGLPIDSAYEAREIVRVLCGWDRAQQILLQDGQVDEARAQAALALAKQRESGEPLGYLLGVSPFFGVDFTVKCGENKTLIPRSDTEILVQALIDRLKAGMCFLDLCCGGGCVALSALLQTEGCEAHGVEKDPGALAVARENTRKLGMTDRFSLFAGDVLRGEPQCCRAPGQYHYIASNPPYIPTAAVDRLDVQVRREPRAALDGGADGLLFYREILHWYSGALADGGAFLFEIGFDQGASLRRLAEENGRCCEIIKDFAGNDRVAILT